jgi:hypothetical protein
VTDVLDARIYPPLRERLVKLGMVAEARTFNLQHVTVVHLHNADPATPKKMLAALTNVPPPLKVTLKNFYNTEAAAGAAVLWWFVLGIVKSGQGYTDMMSGVRHRSHRRTHAVARRPAAARHRTGLRQVRRCGRELVATVGRSGVNVIKDGKETASRNPHNTLVYSMTPYDARIQAAMKEVADEMNKILPNGIDTQFTDVSIVEIGFMGNVLREFYRISLVDGTAWDTTSGQTVKWGGK